MRPALFSILLLSGISLGCAADAPPAESTAIPAGQVPGRYAARPAAALAFTPPLTFAAPPQDLSRENRTIGAFAGYEEVRTEYHHLYQRDQQNTHRGDSLDRRAYTVRSSVTSR